MGLRLAARHLQVRLTAEGTERKLFSIDRLDLAPGATLALYGPSGSGKTTLLNLLAGLQHAPDAQVVWSDQQTGEHDTMQLHGTARDRWRLNHAGLVFQQFQLFGALSALENVLTPYRFDHWRIPAPARSRAGELLQQMGVEATARTGRLSRGEQQRVAIARALVRAPAVIFADEPTASLDPATAARVMDILMEQCTRHAITLVVATHDLTLAPRFDRALALRQGQLGPLEIA